MRLEELKMFLDACYGFDISRKTRKREIVYAKKVFCQIATKYGGFTLENIGKEIKLQHDNVLYHRNTFVAVAPIDLHHYNAAITYFNIPIPHITSINELIYGIEMSSIIKELTMLNVKDLRLFNKNHIQPFKNKLRFEKEIIERSLK